MHFAFERHGFVIENFEFQIYIRNSFSGATEPRDGAVNISPTESAEVWHNSHFANTTIANQNNWNGVAWSVYSVKKYSGSSNKLVKVMGGKNRPRRSWTLYRA